VLLRNNGADWTEYTVPRCASGIELLRAHFSGHAYERHSHDAYAIGVTETGVQAFTCRGSTRASTAGRVIAINPDEPHDGHAGAPEGFTYRMLYLQPEVVRHALADAREGRPAPLPFSRAPVIDDPRLGHLVGALHRALGDGAPELEREALIGSALVRFAVRHCDGGFIVPPARPGDASLRRAHQLLEDTPLAWEVSVAELVRVAGMSRFHLWRAFRRRYGLPPHAYRMQLRLAAAKRLLAAGEPQAAVAAALGFTDQSHLHKRFKGAFGVTPGQFVAALGGR